ncbi:hypothetical protein [Pseudoduganella namucuonensis]|uniref:Uncharacterized protein n=1 Tax=Pseudoduganella namucuonensis TaxID=1035707 RepID=A0A1I7JZV2_9BURK|nr:hypothetical protein [Pseudoduganella namucuonensis]SFU90655.1 hypothetical protein SAMN05216552_101421 [Pseudoduganella namucuonensis]
MKNTYTRGKALLPLLAAATLAAPLPLPDRGGVPEFKLFDYGVMGPPVTPAIALKLSGVAP